MKPEDLAEEVHKHGRVNPTLCPNDWHQQHAGGSQCPQCLFFCARLPGKKGANTEDDPHKVKIEMTDGDIAIYQVPNRGGLWISRDRGGRAEALEVRFADGKRESFLWNRIRSYSIERYDSGKEETNAGREHQGGSPGL